MLREIRREFLGHETLRFLAQILPHQPQEMRRREQIDFGHLARYTSDIESLAERFRERLGHMLSTRNARLERMTDTAGPLRDVAAAIRDRVMVLHTGIAVVEVTAFFKWSLIILGWR
ncbi:MAG: hypothetical protein NVS9B10_15100 [Nevskia sp.]